MIFHKTWGYANWDDAAPKLRDHRLPGLTWYHRGPHDRRRQHDWQACASYGAHTKHLTETGNISLDRGPGRPVLFNAA